MLRSGRLPLRARALLGCFAFALSLGACATGSSGESNDEEVAEADTVVADVGTDTPPADDVAPDDAAPEADGSGQTTDVTEDVEEDPSDQDAPVEPDAAPTDCEVVGDECAPFSVACSDEGVVYCSRCGFVLRTEPCDVGELCEDVDGAGRCRPCEGEECPEVVECVANTRSCFDFDSQLICGSDGRIDSIGDCPAGRRCVDGVCQQPGGDTGDTCTEDAGALTGCAGQLCLCGPADRAANGSDDCGSFPSGYCTTRDCATNGCAPGREVCAAVGTGTRDPFCVAAEGCSRRGAPCGAGFVCNELPTPNAAPWAFGCWPDIASIGDACDSNADCLGGVCRQRTIAGTPVSYCVAPCGESASCPSHASCVTDPENDGAFVCLANGNATDCPRTESERFAIDRTSPRLRFGGGSVSVCYFAGF